MSDTEAVDAVEAWKLSDWLLIQECRDRLQWYEEPNSFFSGHNRMAELAGEVLNRFEEEIKMETNEPNETNIERVEGDVNVEQQDDSGQQDQGQGQGQQDDSGKDDE